MKTQLIKHNPDRGDYVTFAGVKVFFNTCEPCDYIVNGVTFNLCRIQDDGMILVTIIDTDYAKVTFISL